MLKILFLSRSSSSYRNAYTHRLDRLREGLQQLGLKTDILYLGDARTTSHTMIPVYAPSLSRIFHRYDFIHAGGTPCAFVATLCKAVRRTRVIFDVHGDQLGEIAQEKAFGHEGRDLGAFPMAKAFCQETVAVYASDLFFVVSEPLKRLFASRGVDPSRIHIIRNGVDLRLFSPRSDRPRHPRRRTVVYAGKFQPYQAIDDFVDAAVRSIRSGLPFDFQVIGFSDEDFAVRNRILERSESRIRLTDQMSQPELIKRLREADLLVIPRRRSRVTAIAFPTKFAEYIALGKPVLVSDVDESAAFVNAWKCGLVYGEGDAALAAGLADLAVRSPGDWTRMGRNARRLAESEFDWKSICRTYRRILERTADEH
jgi:glycosyltransferase involved in cell wall biosynthesis